MKRTAIYIVTSLVVAGILSAFTALDIPVSILSTLYAVAGVVFSVGMSIAISSKTESVTRKKAKEEIRSSYLRVRNSFMWIFAVDTIFFIATSWHIERFPAFINIAAVIFLLLSIIHFIINFLQLQRLGNNIEDQVLKEMQD